MDSPKAFAFDLDGTLFDTSLAHGLAYQMAFAEVGIHIDPEKYSLVAGLRKDEVIKNLAGSAISELDVDDLHRRKTRYFLDLPVGVIRPLPLIHVAKQISMKFPTALVSSANRATIEKCLRIVDGCGFFEAVVAAEDTNRHKPDPEPYLLAARQLNWPSENILVFEDSPTGITSAKAAGCQVISVGY